MLGWHVFTVASVERVYNLCFLPIDCREDVYILCDTPIDCMEGE